MAQKELTVKTYILMDGERTLISSLPEEEQKRIASALKDKFMLSLGYVPEGTEKKQVKAEMLNKRTGSTY